MEQRVTHNARPHLDKLLKTQPAIWRGKDRYNNTASIPTGFSALDNALPARGWSIGGVTELLSNQSGMGELSLLLPALHHVVRGEKDSASSFAGWAAFINPPHIPYAPAFSNAGIAPERLLIINTETDIDTLWATEQILRAGLFGAVVAWVHKSSAQRQRRLQLAAEVGGCWATVYRPLQASKEHSPVATRICITPGNTSPGNTALSLDIIKVRAGSPQVVTIASEEFDVSQGVEWPVPRATPAVQYLRDSDSNGNSNSNNGNNQSQPTCFPALTGRSGSIATSIAIAQYCNQHGQQYLQTLINQTLINKVPTTQASQPCSGWHCIFHSCRLIVSHAQMRMKRALLFSPRARADAYSLVIRAPAPLAFARAWR